MNQPTFTTLRTATVPIATLRQWAEEQIAMCNQMVAGAKLRNDVQMTERWAGSVNAFKILLDYVELKESELQHGKQKGKV